MSEPIVVTPEMRQAVLDADCLRLGHLLGVATAFSPDELRSTDAATVRGPEPGMFPHLSCHRCGAVWLVIEDPGVDYDDAVGKHKEKLKDPDKFVPKVHPAKPPRYIKPIESGELPIPEPQDTSGDASTEGGIFAPGFGPESAR